jgi:hypothetical protein
MARAVSLPDLPRPEADAIAHGRHGDPFKVLGPRDTSAGRLIRAFLPGARGVEVLRRSDRASIGKLDATQPEGLFEGTVVDRAPYLLRIQWPAAEQETEDPYSFGPAAERSRPSSVQRGSPFRTGQGLRRQRHDRPGRAGCRLRGLGAQCDARCGGG